MLWQSIMRHSTTRMTKERTVFLSATTHPTLYCNIRSSWEMLQWLWSICSLPPSVYVCDRMEYAHIAGYMWSSLWTVPSDSSTLIQFVLCSFNIRYNFCLFIWNQYRCNYIQLYQLRTELSNKCCFVKIIYSVIRFRHGDKACGCMGGKTWSVVAAHTMNRDHISTPWTLPAYQAALQHLRVAEINIAKLGLQSRSR